MMLIIAALSPYTIESVNLLQKTNLNKKKEAHYKIQK